VLIWLVSIVVWIVSFILIRTLSRYREYAADRGSAIITGQPSDLASALMKISGLMDKVPSEDLRTVEGMNAFFTVPALSGSSIMDIFSTHPSVEKRIAKLKKMQQDMG
jgi:heat shock protein HtpX